MVGRKKDKLQECYLDDPIEQRVIQQVKARKTKESHRVRPRKKVYSVDGEMRVFIGNANHKYYTKAKKKSKKKPKKLEVPSKLDYSMQSWLLGKDTATLLKKQRKSK